MSNIPKTQPFGQHRFAAGSMSSSFKPVQIVYPLNSSLGRHVLLFPFGTQLLLYSPAALVQPPAQSLADRGSRLWSGVHKVSQGLSTWLVELYPLPLSVSAQPARGGASLVGVCGLLPKIGPLLREVNMMPAVYYVFWGAIFFAKLRLPSQPPMVESLGVYVASD
jgi:hypothetical protein